VSAFLPPQSAAADEEEDPEALLEDVPELLSLPHAVMVIVATAATDNSVIAGVPSTLPKRLSFTDPTFDSSASGLHGNVCGASGRIADER
jgi:hypothetical protein